jgi:hypothetical protein
MAVTKTRRANKARKAAHKAETALGEESNAAKKVRRAAEEAARQAEAERTHTARHQKMVTARRARRRRTPVR